MDAINKTMGGKGALPGPQCESLDEHVHRAWSSFNDETGADAPAPRRGLTHFPVVEPDGDPRVSMQMAFGAAMPLDSALPAAGQTIRFSDTECSDVEINDTEFNDDHLNADNAGINTAVWQLMPLPLRTEQVPLKAKPSIAGALLPDDASPIPQRSVAAPQFSAGVIPQREKIQTSLVETGQMPQRPRQRIDGKLRAPAPQAALTPQSRVAGSKLREPEATPMAAAEMRAEAKPAMRAGISAVRATLTEPTVIIVDDAIPAQPAGSPRIALTPQRAADSKQIAPATHSSAAGQTISAASTQIQQRGLPAEQAKAEPAKVEQTTATSEHSISVPQANMPQPLPQPIPDALQAAIDMPHKEKLPQQAVSDAPPQPIQQQPLPQRPLSIAPEAAPQTPPKNTPQQSSAAMAAAPAPAPAPASAANGGSTLTYRFDKWNGNHTVTVQAPTKAETPQYILAPSDSVVSQRLSEHLAQSQQNQQMADVPPMRFVDADERQQQQPRQQTPQEDDEDEA